MSSQLTNVEGYWKIVDYPQHPEYAGIKFHITRDKKNQEAYNFHVKIINSLSGHLKRNFTTDEWKSEGVVSTRILAPPEEMKKEEAIAKLISNIKNIKVRDHLLTIKTKAGERVLLERSQ